MGNNEFDSLNWDELDDSFGMIGAADTADLSGVVTFADDGFYDGLDYVSPAQRQAAEPDLSAVPLTVDPEDDMPVYQPLHVAPGTDIVRQQTQTPATTRSGNTPRGPRHVAADAYELPYDDDDDGPSIGGVILAIVLSLAVAGALLWFLLGAGGCTAIKDFFSTPEKSQPAETEDEPGDSLITPTDETETEPEQEPIEEPEEEPEEEPAEEPEEEPETEPEQQPEQEPAEEPEQETQPVWVPEQGHMESERTWVVDTPAWDEPVYEDQQVQVGTVHHDGVYELVEILDEEGNPTGKYNTVTIQEPYDEPVYETQRVQTGTTHHPEEGHYENTQHWVVDVEGHWE